MMRTFRSILLAAVEYVVHTIHHSHHAVLYMCLVTQSCLTLCDPMDYIACQAPLSMGILQAGSFSTEVGCHALLQGVFPAQGLTRSPALQVDSLPSEAPGKHISMTYLFYNRTPFIHFPLLSSPASGNLQLFCMSLSLFFSSRCHM